jgi:cell division protein FtsX
MRSKETFQWTGILISLVIAGAIIALAAWATINRESSLPF